MTAPELHPVSVVRRALAGAAGGLPRLFERAVEALEAEALESLSTVRRRLEAHRIGGKAMNPGKERARQAGLEAAFKALDSAERSLRESQDARKADREV